MSVASGLIAGGLHERILVIGADTMSRIVDWSDRSTCVLFGDGAGAILLQRSETPTGLRAAVLGSDGSGINSLYIPAGGSRLPLTPELLQSRKNCISMKGSEVYRFAVQTVAHATNQALNAAGLDIDDIDLFIPHQANIRIIQSAAKSLKIPAEKVYTNVHRYGNTSAASIPIALCEAVESGRVQAGANLAIVGFGAGLSWGAAVVQWGLDTTPVPISWWKSVVRNFHRREAVVRSFALRTQRRLDALRRLNGVHEA